ncbi:MAG: PfkB family carbohydrate kinase [Nanoarchaeota archaeon]|nr:PfkB family carbohydrate kinase [Nanoarchaeota archaeon]
MLERPLLCFGEVLWDVFPDGKVLGGAPLNFSYYFQREGGNPKLISSVGRDEYGDEILERIRELNIDADYIGRVDRPTGIVEISLGLEGHQFKIGRDMAWEYVSYPGDKLVFEAAGVYFGTIARISERNRNNLDKLLGKLENKLIFFDLNLREDFVNWEDIEQLLSSATHLKINENEAVLLRRKGLTRGRTYRDILSNLIGDYGLRGGCITLGKEGAVGGDRESMIRVQGIPVESIGDTVGCGDAFAATWFSSLLKGYSQEDSIRKANEVASKVASRRGSII